MSSADLGNYIKAYEEEKDAVESLYAEFKKLNELPQTDTRSQERLSAIIDELSAKYPDLLANVKKEKGAYEGVDEAIQGIIASLNEKINLQILDDFNTEIQKLKIEATKAEQEKVISNTGTATVYVVEDKDFDNIPVIGKVFHDRDGDGYQDEAIARGVKVTLSGDNNNPVTIDTLGRTLVIKDTTKPVARFKTLPAAKSSS